MTDFNQFANATGVQIEDLSTIEGLVEVSKKYYEYTDGLTSTPNDGKAFFGRDAFANYIVIGLKQLGHDIIQVKDGKATLDFDKTAVRNYGIIIIHHIFMDILLLKVDLEVMM